MGKALGVIVSAQIARSAIAAPCGAGTGPRVARGRVRGAVRDRGVSPPIARGTGGRC
jgi:hypothetical protein